MQVLTIVYFNHGYPDKEGTSLRVMDEDPGIPQIFNFHSLGKLEGSLSIGTFLQTCGLTLRQARVLLPTANLVPNCSKEPLEALPDEILDTTNWYSLFLREQFISKHGPDIQPLANFLNMPIVGYARYRRSERNPERWFRVDPM